MPFLPANTIIDAVTESTEKYLNFLCEQEVGFESYRAHSITLTPEDPYLLENKLWKIYVCNLPQHLAIQPDSSATLIPDINPGQELEIRFLEYDRRNGQARLACLEIISGNTANIVIDFRWIVRRCLEWFRNRGNSINNIESISRRTTVNVEFQQLDNGLSEEQRLAIKTMLNSGLSYIWGPPGTGKTKLVLAKAVSYCINQHKKVIVLASTNLAVDNALSAILEEGVAKEDVARIGIATPLFIQQYPECVEERAFHAEIRQIQSQIQILESNKALLYQTIKLESEITQTAGEIEITRCHLNELQLSLEALQKDTVDKHNTVARRRDELSALESNLENMHQKLGSYAFSELLANIKILENEQTNIIRNNTEQQSQLKNIGFFANVFTNRKQKNLDLILRQEKHLHSVEETLYNKRQERDRLSQIVYQLETEIKKVQPVCAELRGITAKLHEEISALDKKQQELQLSISVADKKMCDMESQLESAKAKRPTIGNDSLIESREQQLDDLQFHINGLNNQLAQFKQDLSRKTVLGMTLDGFIGLTAQTGISTDHIFIDEAPYAPIAKTLPLLSLNRPISMLGDHRQLPPVCECNNDNVICSYWAKPAIYLEESFRYGADWASLNALEDPQFKITQQRNLTKSYRFSQSLADVLDFHIYDHIGLTGVANDNTSIKCIHCEPSNNPYRINRENHSEADAIVEKIKKWWVWAQQQPSMPTIAVLSPYKNQVRLIRQRLIQLDAINSSIREHVEVWNTHKAQGREWDCVLFSVSDTANLQGNDPYFTDTRNGIGRAVLNTTISRTKQHLIIFLDQNYWAHRTPKSLLIDLANR